VFLKFGRRKPDEGFWVVYIWAAWPAQYVASVGRQQESVSAPSPLIG
jgi:hypothetical protein